MALRKGNQVPTFSTVGKWERTDGAFAAEMFGSYGVRFYESQARELDVFLARNAQGGYAGKTICISKPRQNGKSFAARMYAVWMAAIEGRHVLYSAHHGKTVRKMFKEVMNFVEGNPDFAEMLKPGNRGVYAAAGSEGFYFVDEDGRDAGIIEFQTRTNSAGRGETYQVIIVDEAQELTADQLEALKPTTIASGDAADVDSDPQMIYLGTPPNPKCIGTEFRRWHDEAHSDAASSIWWMEWAVPAMPATRDRAELMELVYETNPAMGHRIKESTMLDVMDTMSADGFARECLGWWDKTIGAAYAIDAADWAACRNESPVRDGIEAYAVVFTADGARGCLAACNRHDDGASFVHVRAFWTTDEGLGRFADVLAGNAGKAAQVVVSGKSNAAALVELLRERKVGRRLVACPNTAEVVAACSSFANAVREGKVEHFGQPLLDTSATGSVKRMLGGDGGWCFESHGGAEAALVTACALAYRAAATTRRDPRRKGRIGC